MVTLTYSVQKHMEQRMPDIQIAIELNSVGLAYAHPNNFET